MKLTEHDKLCRYYMKGGLCSHPDAPKPQHSRCIGKPKCEHYKQKNKEVKANARI